MAEIKSGDEISQSGAQPASASALTPGTILTTTNDTVRHPVPEKTTEVALESRGTVATTPPPPRREYLKGWRLYTVFFGLCLSLFLSTLETSIVSTSLVSITNALGGFEQRDWVVTSYLISYTAFLTIYAKFSDILGRKTMMLLALGIFTVFSIVCGSVSDMTQLIVFRALQGMGASGVYAMSTIIQPELVTPEDWGKLAPLTSMVYVLSSVLGPVLGGVINDHSSWRWVFLLNAPAGAVATAFIAFSLPTNFPNHGSHSMVERVPRRKKFSREHLARLDVIGAILLLASCALVVFALEEAGTRYAWSSPIILSTIIVGGVSFLLFILWEHISPKIDPIREPVFPLRLMKSRIFTGVILTGFFTGPPFMTVLINLPQRFQAVDGASAFDAGIHLLPLLLMSPLAILVAAGLATKLKVPPFYLLLGASALQILGIGLTLSIPFRSGAEIYGYEVIMGFGFGMGLISLILFIPVVVERADLAVAMGSITQIRVLGGTIGLAISATVLNNHVSSRLPSLLDSDSIQKISESIQYINELPPTTQEAVRRIFADGYKEQFQVNLYLTAVVLLCVLLLWERKLRRIEDMKEF